MNQKDYWNSVAEEKKFTTVLDVELFSKYVSKNSKILDVGCGYGRILNELSESGFVDLTGIDSAEKMIKRGLREYPNLNLIANPDGATVRHHAEDYILKLLSDFKTLDYQKLVIPTMNGNKSNSFGFIGELKNKAD